MDPLLVQGRAFGADDLDQIRELMETHPRWGRFRLSIHLAQQWNWRNHAGRLKDMSVRAMLLKLEEAGLLRLPPRQGPCGGSRKPCRAEAEVGLFSPVPITGLLHELLPLRVHLVETREGRRTLSTLLQRYHYLGYYRPVGENVPYLVESRCGRLLGCAVFSAAAWKCAPRDRFIGWSPETRQARLELVVNNMRFLIAPWVVVRHLASHLLSVLTDRLSGDWQSKYGHRIDLVETFVERDRFAGTVYRAANWIHVGQTQGRGRRGPSPNIRSATIKDVYLWPLGPGFRQALCAAG